MENLIFDIICTGYVRNLHGLKGCLLKAKKHAEDRKFDPNLYLNSKLAVDMFNFTKQIQFACDNAKGAVARLGGRENPQHEDNEKTFDEIVARVEKTINFISTFKPEDFKNFSHQKATFPWYPGKHLEGKDYLVSFAIPNFYFHLTCAYSILRHSGVNLGKSDFLGELNWK
jgi:hypothetical protein